MSLCIYRSLFLAIVKKVPAFGQLTVPSSFCKHTHRPLKRHYTEKERTNRFWRLQCRCMRGLFLPFPLLFPVFFCFPAGIELFGQNFESNRITVELCRIEVELFTIEVELAQPC